mgnify:CR=1 FL=1
MPPPQPLQRARRPTLLIVGCGDVGQRVLPLVLPRWRVLALTSSPARVPVLRDFAAFEDHLIYSEALPKMAPPGFPVFGLMASFPSSMRRLASSEYPPSSMPLAFA